MSYDLDTRLLKLGPNSYVSARTVLEGIHIWGGIGSGKTSGSGKAIAQAVLRAGWGGIVCIAKPNEVDRWLDYAKQNGRINSIIIFDASRGYNFISHELARQGTAGLPNVTEALMQVLEAADRAMGTTGQSSEPFWDQAARAYLNHAIPAVHAAWGPGAVSVSSILDFVTTAATKPELYTDAAWVNANYAGQTLRRLVDDPTIAMPPDVRDAVLAYWIREYPAIPEKTRGNIGVTLSAKLDRFRIGRLRSCFCDKTDILPEMTFGGAIIVLALPALTFNADGIIGQQLFKFMWQRVVESRASLAPIHRERPVFCFADESHLFTNSYDDSFIATSRESRAAMIYISQALPSYYAKFGRDRTDAADGLIGKFSTQVFHLNSCNKTNTYASQLIGRGIQHRATKGHSHGTSTSQGLNAGANTGGGSSSGHSISHAGSNAGFGSNSGSSSSSGNSWGDSIGRGSNEGQSWSAAETLDYLVEPRFFAQGLRSGGPAHNNYRVDALWFKAGAAFKDAGGENFMLTTFKQK